MEKEPAANHVEESSASSIHVYPDAVPVSFGETLPKMTNKQAEANAESILAAVKDAVEHEKTTAAYSTIETKRKVHRMLAKLHSMSRERLAEAKLVQAENVDVAKQNLKRAQNRRSAAVLRAEKEKAEEDSTAAEVGRVETRMAKKEEDIAVSQANAKQDAVEKDMAGVLNGQESHDNSFDAKLYAPETLVVTEAEMAKIKAAKDKKSAAAKTEEVESHAALVATEARQAASRKATKAKLEAETNAKKAAVHAAMVALTNAKKALNDAVGQEPKAKGLADFVEEPATSNRGD